MIRAVEFEVYQGEEASGVWVATAPTMKEAADLAREATAETRVTHAIVRVTRHIEGIYRIPAGEGDE